MENNDMDAIRARLAAFEAARSHGPNLYDHLLLNDLQTQFARDIRALLDQHDADAAHQRDLEYEIAELRASVSRERSDERSDTILDARKYLAEGLRKLGIEADDKISLTEVIALVEEQNVRIAALETALADARVILERAHNNVTVQSTLRPRQDTFMPEIELALAALLGSDAR